MAKKRTSTNVVNAVPKGGTQVEQTMNCITCGNPMSPILVLGVKIDRCAACKAVWFDPGEIADVLRHSDPSNQELPTEAHFRLYSSADPAACPRCANRSLQSGVLSAVPFRSCRTCRGVLFLEKDLLRLAGRARSTHQPPPGGLFDIGRVDPVDFGLHLLFCGLDVAIMRHLHERLADTVTYEIH